MNICWYVNHVIHVIHVFIWLHCYYKLLVSLVVILENVFIIINTWMIEDFKC